MYDVINQKYMLRQHVKQEGLKRNSAAFEVVRAGILKANSVADSKVTSVGPGVSSVQSLSTSGHHRVSHALTGSNEATCTCRARCTAHVCWHIIKCLLLAGASEDQLLKRLGIFWGSRFGGYSALYEAMRPAAGTDSGLADTTETVQPSGTCTAIDRTAQAEDAGQACDSPADVRKTSDGDEASAERSHTGAAPATAPFSAAHRPVTPEKALEAVERLKAASAAWPRDSENWQRLYFHAEQAHHDLQRGIAQAAVSGCGPAGGVLLPNPNAPEGNGLKRLPDFLERKRGRKRRKAVEGEERKQGQGLRQKLRSCRLSCQCLGVRKCQCMQT